MDHSASSGPGDDPPLQGRKAEGPERSSHLPTATQLAAPDGRRSAPATGSRASPSLAAGISSPSRAPGPGLSTPLPRAAQPVARERAPPGRAFPTSLGAGLSLFSFWHPQADRRELSAPRVPCGGAVLHFPPLPRQTSPPAPFTFLGALQQLSVLCSQPILLRGAPERLLPTRGPQRTLPSGPRCPLRARQPGLPARP